MKNKFIERTLAGLNFIEVPGDPDGAYIILFHGFGSDATDLVPLSQVYQGRRSPTWIFPNGPMEIPIAPGYTGRAWFPIDLETLKSAVQDDNLDRPFMAEFSESCRQGESLIAALNIPRSKLVLGGFSQGAVLATEMVLLAPQRVAALLIFSGTLLNGPNLKRFAHFHAGTPFFQSHGTEDPLLPLKRAQELERLLCEGGLKGKLHLFHGGHEIPKSILSQLKQFLKNILEPLKTIE